jgi:ABC-type multidrug transport system fused ATPase/permease subunit
MKLPKNINKLLKKLTTAIIVFFVLAILSFVSVKVKAQEAVRSYTITPPSITQKLNPGQNAEGVLKVINDTDHDLTFTASIRDFIVEDTMGTPVLIPNNNLSNRFSAASWMGVTPATFTVKSGQRAILNYYINVPTTARPGGHYAAVTYSPTDAISISGTGATVNTQAGTLFYITVNGPITEKSQITKFFVNPFQEYGPVKVLTQIKNLGDLHISPNATINVSGLFYNQSKTLDAHNIFPEAARDFETTIGQSFMIGRYKAVLMGSYGVNNNLPLVTSVYFWVFPWRMAIIVVLAVIALILAALYLKKRSKKGPKEPKKTGNEPVAVTPPAEATI